MTLQGHCVRGVVVALAVGSAAVSGAEETSTGVLYGPRTYAVWEDGQRCEPVLLELGSPLDLVDLEQSSSVMAKMARLQVVPPEMPPEKVAESFLAQVPSEGSGRELKLRVPGGSRGLGVRRALASATPGTSYLCLGMRLLGGDYVPSVDATDGDLEAPLIQVSKDSIDAAVRSAQVYLRIMAVDRVDDALWREVCTIPNSAARYVAVRDVLTASYKRGLSVLPLGLRERVLREASAAVGAEGDPEATLKLVLLLRKREPSPEARAVAAGDDRSWWLDVVSRGRPEAARLALSASTDDSLAPLAMTIRVELVVRLLRREEPLSAADVVNARRLLEGSSLDAASSRGAELVYGIASAMAVSVDSQMELLHLLDELLSKAPSALEDASESDRRSIASRLAGTKADRPEDRAILERLRNRYPLPGTR